MARRREEVGIEVYVFDKEFLRPGDRLVHESCGAGGPVDFREIVGVRHYDRHGDPCVRSWYDRVLLRRWSDEAADFVRQDVDADYIRKDCSWRGVVPAKRTPR